MRSAVVLVALAGCLAPDSSTCPSGRLCRPGTVCLDALDQCVAPAQVEACAGAGDGDRCAAPGVPLGVCTMSACISSGCGNGTVEPPEVCDDGNTIGGDRCSADCLSDESC